MSRGVLFDLDETLLDRRSTLLNYASDLYSEFHASAYIARREFIELLEDLDGRGRAPRDQFFRGLSERAFERISTEALEEHFYSCAWLKPVVFPGVLECLTAIREKDIPIGVVTNGRETSQSAKIANSGIRELVDACVISEAFGARKPEAAIFLYAAELLNISPNASWHVGDDPVADVIGASRLGFKTIWLERHLPWPEEYPRYYDLRASQVSEVAGELVAA